MCFAAHQQGSLLLLGEIICYLGLKPYSPCFPDFLAFLSMSAGFGNIMLNLQHRKAVYNYKGQATVSETCKVHIGLQINPLTVSQSHTRNSGGTKTTTTDWKSSVRLQRACCCQQRQGKVHSRQTSSSVCPPCAARLQPALVGKLFRLGVQRHMTN